MKHSIQQLAEILDKAAYNATAVEQLSLTQELNIAQAYAIQEASIYKRVERKEVITGIKLGFTSKAKMEQMGVHDLIWGRITDAMEIKNDGILNRNKFIHPRAEPEIAYLVKQDIKGILNEENVLNYIEAVAPAIEIIDSRYKNFKFSLEDVIADNCSSSAYVLGEWSNANTNASNIELSLSINGEQVEKGNSNAILGNPLNSFIEATRITNQYGVTLKKGMIVLAGAATPACFINKNDKVNASFGKLGNVKFQVH